MAPRRDQERQQQGQRLTQATLRQHTDDNPSLPPPTGGRAPTRDEARGRGDGQHAAGDDMPAGTDAAAARLAQADDGGTAPLQRGLSDAVQRAAEEGLSVSTGLTPDAPRFSDDTLRPSPPEDAPPREPPPASSQADRGGDMAEAAAAAVAAVDGEERSAAASPASAEQGGAGGAAGEEGRDTTMTAADRAADEGVSVSTGLGDGASVATDTTFQRGATSGRPSFETSLATISEAGAAGQAARAGVSVSTGLDGAASVASDTTVQSAGVTPAFCISLDTGAPRQKWRRRITRTACPTSPTMRQRGDASSPQLCAWCLQVPHRPINAQGWVLPTNTRLSLLGGQGLRPCLDRPSSVYALRSLGSWPQAAAVHAVRRCCSRHSAAPAEP